MSETSRDALVNRGFNQILIKDGRAYIPFGVDDLYWLMDKFPPSDTYRQVIWAVIQQLEAEKAQNNEYRTGSNTATVGSDS